MEPNSTFALVGMSVGKFCQVVESIKHGRRFGWQFPTFTYGSSHSDYPKQLPIYIHGVGGSSIFNTPIEKQIYSPAIPIELLETFLKRYMDKDGEKSNYIILPKQYSGNAAQFSNDRKYAEKLGGEVRTFRMYSKYSIPHPKELFSEYYDYTFGCIFVVRFRDEKQMSMYRMRM